MTVLLVIIHVIISVFLILVVLLQQGKGADLQGAFGGGGSQTAFGARGATTLLHKLTTGFFVAFVVTSLSLAILQARPRSSVMSTTPSAPAPVKK
ncbi:MAG TPA: preprotein translocase subunit SecG [Thermoanaerobaculia bacterium]|nr:preprotein translocase subunit SecG [Thermoanaerobaculia bacterium]